MTEPPSSATGREPAVEDGPGRPLRIGFFTDSFEPTHDGVANVTSTLAGTLARLGHDVTVYTVRLPGLGREERRDDGVRVRRFLSLPAPGYPQYRVALSPWGIAARGGAKFDVVHIHTPGFVGLAGWLAACGGNVPSVGTYHTNLTDMLRGAGRSRAARRFFRAWSRFSVDLCAWCDLATAPSESARAPLIGPARLRGRPDPWVVPNGVDTERFRPGIVRPDWRTRLGIGGGTLVAFVGRLTQTKGVLRFLEAIGQVDPAVPLKAVIAGEGPLRPVVEDRLRRERRLQSRVVFLGPVTEAEKPALLSQSDLFALPSTADTSSVALLEAMACGSACVVSREGGPGEIARLSQTGLLIDPEDPGELARALVRLVNDPSTTAAWATRGRAWVEANASAYRMARRFLEGYRTVVDGERSVSPARER